MSEQKEQTINDKTLQELKEGVEIKVYESINQIIIKIGKYRISVAPKDNWFAVEHDLFKNELWGMFYKNGSEKEIISISTFSEKIEVDKDDHIRFIGYRLGE